MITFHRMIAFTTLGCSWALTGCAPAVATQPNRLALLKDKIDENLQKNMNCQDTTLTFLRTEKKGLEIYDFYTVDGCGQKSEYATMVYQQSTGGGGTYTNWAYGLAPTEADFEAAVREQLTKTAGFELGCDAVDLTVLNALIMPMHNGYEATLGASGCGKKGTYHTQCAPTGFANNKHEISCRNVVTSTEK